MGGFDWDSVGASIGAAIVTIREMLSTDAKVEIIRERMGVVADRLDLAKDQMTYLRELLTREESRAAQLAEELAKVREENRALETKVHALNKAGQAETFAERGGFYFKQDVTGRWSDIGYCPNCRSAIARSNQTLTCSNKGCNWAMLGGAHRMASALAQLRAQDALPGKTASDYDPFAES